MQCVVTVSCAYARSDVTELNVGGPLSGPPCPSTLKNLCENKVPDHSSELISLLAPKCILTYGY